MLNFSYFFLLSFHSILALVFLHSTLFSLFFIVSPFFLFSSSFCFSFLSFNSLLSISLLYSPNFSLFSLNFSLFLTSCLVSFFVLFGFVFLPIIFCLHSVLISSRVFFSFCFCFPFFLTFFIWLFLLLFFLFFLLFRVPCFSLFNSLSIFYSQSPKSSNSLFLTIPHVSFLLSFFIDSHFVFLSFFSRFLFLFNFFLLPISTDICKEFYRITLYHFNFLLFFSILIAYPALHIISLNQIILLILIIMLIPLTTLSSLTSSVSILTHPHSYHQNEIFVNTVIV